MTTPRVTVPVEPTVRMLSAGAAHMRDDALYTPNSVWSAMLSAAPAPEGGAVSPQVFRLLQLADAALANVTAFEADARYIMGNTNYAITDNARSEIRQFLLALATREKAPERRECDECGFKGTSDDASKEQDYCTACGGNSPAGAHDECAHCGAKNHMVMACPKCGGRFSLDEDTREEAPAEVLEVAHEIRIQAGDKVTATRGPKKGHRGKIIEPVGVNTSWVKWVGEPATPYPHRSLKVEARK